ncbi:MAG TPA: serine protease, partial [Gemmataceae bacterium]|nr:serine protease [Gemmataceae bacterium]
MPRFLPLVVAVLAFTPAARSDDALTPETLAAVKKATVFIRVEAGGWSATGSGFVVADDGKTLLIATNDHVASARPPSGRPPTVTVVFESGTKAERSYPAQIAASDPARDLAVLRVAGVKDPPRPIAYADTPQPVETTAVYTFGFPFGKALAVGGGSPAVTVGKASVSSLRHGSDGELAAVQLDGSLNPGNSGGPVVDAKGRLVGVAVSRVRDGQGIGFAVPAQELDRLMRGRVGPVRVATRKAAGGGVTVRVEADLLDPSDRLRGAVAHYLVVPSKGKAPDPAAFEKDSPHTRLELKVEKGVAAGEF